MCFESEKPKTEARCPSGAAANLQASTRQVGGAYTEDLQHKLYIRQSKLAAELREVEKALEILNSDQSVQRVLEVISVANK